jgi:hypothetical protein
VAYDYAKRLSIGQSACDVLTGEAVSKLASLQGTASTKPFVTCPLLNVSVCQPTTNIGNTPHLTSPHSISSHLISHLCLVTT